ncbi:conserved hypothetical protein [Mesorhizobium sp. ORS 3324]|nr:conserved hypothetical protein [Mesorhizobium sp. ORS 3324]
MASSTGKNRDAPTVVEDHEIEHFARQNGVTIEEVKLLIAEHGNDRTALSEAAMALRGSGNRDASAADKVTRRARQQATPSIWARRPDRTDFPCREPCQMRPAPIGARR